MVVPNGPAATWLPVTPSTVAETAAPEGAATGTCPEGCLGGVKGTTGPPTWTEPAKLDPLDGGPSSGVPTKGVVVVGPNKCGEDLRTLATI